MSTLNKQTNCWAKGLNIIFDTEKRKNGRLDLGDRLKELRVQKGLSQTELAKQVGVTPSTISQVESNQINLPCPR
ncbi:MAG: helix-turn-helix domain-containing protein [Desulfobacterales bacterium]|nr:helix-turn-helix domain-containing protein [Desulfobacterales bacterium]